MCFSGTLVENFSYLADAFLQSENKKHHKQFVHL